jgi:hypothetical protein
MWLNAIFCGIAAMLSFVAVRAAKSRETTTDSKQPFLG